MTEFNVIQGGRQSGKTYRMMTEIHDLIVAGRTTEILIVFPAKNWLHWWVREWNARFPFVPLPDYTTINNTLNIRGRVFSKVYVEDVDQIEGGIYNPRFDDIFMTLFSPFDDEEVVFTSSLIPTNQRSHNATLTKNEVLKRWKRSTNS